MKASLFLAASLLLPSASLAANPVVRFAFDPTLGYFDLELCQATSATGCLQAAPNTVANFLQYVNRGDYGRGSFVHRDVPSFVIQGGSFSIDATGVLGVVPDLAPVANEFDQFSNLRGTVAVPLIGNSSDPCDTQPDSGSSGWFVNLDDNSSLDCGKFTVFGVVTGNGMQTADRIAALTPYDLSGGAQSPFTDVPFLDTYPCDPDPVSHICTADYLPYLVYYTVHPLLFDDGGPNTAGGSLLSDFDTPRQRADDFLLAGPGPTKLGAVQWWGQYLDSNTAVALDDFRVRVFADDGGGAGHLPTGPPLAERQLHNILRADTGIVSNGFHVFEYLATFPAFELPPGRYWLSIVNDTTGDATSHWYWARSDGAAGDDRVRNQDGDPWTLDGVGPGTLAFALLPEPGAAAQGLAVLLVIGALRRVRRCV